MHSAPSLSAHQSMTVTKRHLRSHTGVGGFSTKTCDPNNALIITFSRFVATNWHSKNHQPMMRNALVRHDASDSMSLLGQQFRNSPAATSFKWNPRVFQQECRTFYNTLSVGLQIRMQWKIDWTNDGQSAGFLDVQWMTNLHMYNDLNWPRWLFPLGRFTLLVTRLILPWPLPNRRSKLYTSVFENVRFTAF